MNSCVPNALGSVTPPQLGLRVTGALGADALPPVVLVREAAARPPHVRHLERLERGDHVVADAPGVGDRGVRADPDSLVDAVAEVLRELAEDVAVDLGAGLGRVDRESDLLGHRGRRDENDQRGGAEQAPRRRADAPGNHGLCLIDESAGHGCPPKTANTLPPRRRSEGRPEGVDQEPETGAYWRRAADEHLLVALPRAQPGSVAEGLKTRASRPRRLSSALRNPSRRSWTRPHGP